VWILGHEYPLPPPLFVVLCQPSCFVAVDPLSWLHVNSSLTMAKEFVTGFSYKTTNS
jgi:hypothetical protein